MPEPTREYVVLRHVLPASQHWDLMLDLGEVMATWQLAHDPAALAPPDAKTALPAKRIADHRRAYLDYQGPVSNQRGQVARVDKGRFEIVERTADAWLIRLDGQLLKGEFRLHPAAPGSEGRFQRSGI